MVMGARTRRPAIAAAAIAVTVALVATWPAAGVEDPTPVDTNQTYQPTNAEWLARNAGGEDPVPTVIGPANPSGKLVRTPDGDVAVGQPITFDGSGSTARKNQAGYGGTSIRSWVWDFGDGTQANAPVVHHSYKFPGVYHAQLSVHDDTGWRATRGATVVVGDAPCGSDAQEIWVPTGNGLRMHGFLTTPAGPGPAPVILEYGPYGVFPRDKCDDAVRNGFAYAHIAAPGREKSTGTWDMFGRQTQQGGYDAVEWLASQPWSNGKVAMWGLSGPACAAMLVAGSRPPHLVAVIAKSSYSDMYRDIITAGGVPNSDTFVNAWLPLLTAQDFQSYGNGVGPNQEVVDHGIANLQRQLDLADHPFYDSWWAERSPTAYPSPTAAVLYFGNQRDLWPRATVEFSRWIAPGGGRVISNPGGHTSADLTGWEAGNNSADYLTGESRAWLDHFLLGRENGVERRPPVLTFSTYGGDAAAAFDFGRWEQLDGFPSAQTVPVQFALGPVGGADGATARPTYRELVPLSSAPADGSPPAPLVYSPAQGATSDDTAATAPQVAGLQESWESQSLVYETPPLTDELPVNGPAALSFHARLLAPDMGFTVHINDVWPDGSSHYVSKGALLASHRDLDMGKSLWLGSGAGRVLVRPWHPHTAASAERLVPGQAYQFDVEIWGVHNVFRPGHRLRLVITAQDTGWRTNATPGAAALILSDPSHPSTLNLAVLPSDRSARPFPWQ